MPTPKIPLALNTPVPTDYDNTYMGQLFTTVENPDSIGYENGRWYQFKDAEGFNPKKFDPYGIGIGLDVRYNNYLQNYPYHVDSKGRKYLTEEEERNIRHHNMYNAEQYLDNALASSGITSAPDPIKKATTISYMLNRGSEKVKPLLNNASVMDSFVNGTPLEYSQKVNGYFAPSIRGTRGENTNTWVQEASSRRERMSEAYRNKRAEIARKLAAVTPIPYTSSAGSGISGYVQGLKQKYGLKAEGGSLNNSTWDSLSLKEKNDVIKVAIKNGLTTIPEIKAKYNELNSFDNGGSINKDWEDWKTAVKLAKGIDVDKDNTYDYRSFYEDSPEQAWQIITQPKEAHFTDRYKTVYHPTFSTESTYSGKYHPIHNPNKLVGGKWRGKEFIMSPDGYRGSVSMDDRLDYLEMAEPNGVVLRESNGKLPRYSNIFDNTMFGGVLPEATVTPNSKNSYPGGGYLNVAKRLIRENEGFRSTPYKDGGQWTRKYIPNTKTRRNPKTGELEYWDQWYSVGYGFNDSGSRNVYPLGIARNRYWNGITKAEAERELDRILNSAVSHLARVYKGHWENWDDNKKGSVLDTFWQNPESVIGKKSRFLAAIKADDPNAWRYLGVRGYDTRNRKRQAFFNGTASHSNRNNSSNANQGYIYDVLPGLLKNAGLNIKVTSGFRPGSVTTSGVRSRHSTHEAVDIVPMGKTTYDDIRNAIYTNPDIYNYMLTNGIGFLDETSATGTTKYWHDQNQDHSHFHFGKDSGIARRYADKMAKKAPSRNNNYSEAFTFTPSNPQAFFNPELLNSQQVEVKLDNPLVDSAEAYAEELQRQDALEKRQNANNLLGMLLGGSDLGASPFTALANSDSPLVSLASMMQGSSNENSNPFDYTANLFASGGPTIPPSSDDRYYYDYELPENGGDSGTLGYIPRDAKFAPNKGVWFKETGPNEVTTWEAYQGNLPEATVIGHRKGILPELVTPVDNTRVTDPLRPIDTKNPELANLAIEGNRQHAQWAKEHPYLDIAGGVAPLLPAAVVSAPYIASSLSTLPTLGTAIKSAASNPYTWRRLGTSLIGGLAVDKASKLATGKSWGENAARGVDYLTGWDLQNSGLGRTIMDFTNPGYFAGGVGFINRGLDNIERRAFETAMRTSSRPDGLQSTLAGVKNLLHSSDGRRRLGRIGNYILTGKRGKVFGDYNSFSASDPYTGFFEYEGAPNLTGRKDIIDAFLYGDTIDPAFGVKKIAEGENFGIHAPYIAEHYAGKASKIPVYEVDTPGGLHNLDVLPLRTVGKEGSFATPSKYAVDAQGHIGQIGIDQNDLLSDPVTMGQDIWKFNSDYFNRYFKRQNLNPFKNTIIKAGLKELDRLSTPIITRTKWVPIRQGYTPEDISSHTEFLNASLEPKTLTGIYKLKNKKPPLPITDYKTLQGGIILQ